MNCPKCQAEIPADDALFCPACGTALSSQEFAAAADTEITVKQNKPTQTVARQPIKKESKIVFVILAFVVLISIFVYQSFFKAKSPEEVATSFMKAMQSQDYRTAYKYLAKTDDKLLSKANFVKAQQAQDEKFGKINEFQINFREKEREMERKMGAAFRQDTDSLPLIFQVSESRNEPIQLSISMTNLGDADKPDWKIELPDLYHLYQFNLCWNLNVEAKLDGIVIPVEDGEISFMVFEDAKHNLVIVGQDVAPLTVTLPTNWAYPLKLDVSEELQKKIEGVIRGFNQADIKAHMDYDTSHYYPYVKQETGGRLASSLWDRLQYYISDYKLQGAKKQAELMSISYKSAEFSGRNQVQIVVDETWRWETIYQNGDVDAYSNHNVTWKYELERQDDGKWLISSKTLLD